VAERTPRGAAKAFFETHVMEPTDGCRLWPFSRQASGYGQLSTSVETFTVAVLTCERWHGARPRGMEVAHSCGVRACWAGEHLRWATKAENEADKRLHGTSNAGVRNGKAKLTEEIVAAIRRRYVAGGITQRMLAAEHGLSQGHVSDILNGRKW
jgi:hypothetical protein